MTQPENLPGDPKARASQIHSNVSHYLQRMVEDTALTLRGPMPSSTVADGLAGRAMRSDPNVIASVFAAAVVALAERHNEDNKLEKIDLPSIEWPDDARGTLDRAARFCLSLNELLFSQGVLIASVLDIEIQDPVKNIVIAQGLRYDTEIGRYVCQGAPPHQWQIP